MAIYLSLCKQKQEQILWQIIPNYYGEDFELDEQLEKFFDVGNVSESIESQLKKINLFEKMFNIKFQNKDNNWLKNIQDGKSTMTTFYAPQLNLELIGRSRDEREFTMGFSALNFHRFFNDYLNLNISETGKAQPSLFLNALKSAPPAFFGSTHEEDLNTIIDPTTGKEFSHPMFGISEEYIINKKLLLQEICQEAINRNEMICWRGF